MLALWASHTAWSQASAGHLEVFGGVGLQSPGMNYFVSKGYTFSTTEGYTVTGGLAYYLRDQKQEWHVSLEGVYRRSALTTSQFINPELGYYQEDFGQPKGNYIEQFPGIQLSLGYGFYITNPADEYAVGLRIGATGFYKFTHQVIYYGEDQTRTKDDFQAFLPGLRLEWPFFFRTRRTRGAGFTITWIGDMFFAKNNNETPGTQIKTNLTWDAQVRLGYRF